MKAAWLRRWGSLLACSAARAFAESPLETRPVPRTGGVEGDVRGVSWSEVATVPKRKSHRGLDLNLSLNTEVNIWKGWKENGGTK